MWRLGRMEWLAFQLVVEARRALRDRQNKKGDTLWKNMEQKNVRSPTEIELGIAITPHKMRLPGNMLESSAPGLANGRTSSA